MTKDELMSLIHDAAWDMVDNLDQGDGKLPPEGSAEEKAIYDALENAWLTILEPFL